MQQLQLINEKEIYDRLKIRSENWKNLQKIQLSVLNALDKFI